MTGWLLTSAILMVAGLAPVLRAAETRTPAACAARLRALAGGQLLSERGVSDACTDYYLPKDGYTCMFQYLEARSEFFMTQPGLSRDLCMRVGYQAAGGCELEYLVHFGSLPAAIDKCRWLEPPERKCISEFFAEPGHPDIGEVNEVCRSRDEKYRKCFMGFLRHQPPFDKPLAGRSEPWNYRLASTYCDTFNPAGPCVPRGEGFKRPENVKSCVLGNLYAYGCETALKIYRISPEEKDEICRFSSVEVQACTVVRRFEELDLFAEPLSVHDIPKNGTRPDSSPLENILSFMAKATGSSTKTSSSKDDTSILSPVTRAALQCIVELHREGQTQCDANH